MIDSNDTLNLSNDIHTFECLDFFDESLDFSILIPDEEDRGSGLSDAVSVQEFGDDIIVDELFDDSGSSTDLFDKSKPINDTAEGEMLTAMKKLDECMKKTSETRKMIEKISALNALPQPMNETESTKKTTKKRHTTKKIIRKFSPIKAAKVMSTSKLVSRNQLQSRVPIASFLIRKRPDFAITGCMNKPDLKDMLFPTAQILSKKQQLLTFSPKREAGSISTFLRNRKSQNCLVY